MERQPVYLDSNVIIDIADGRENDLLGLLIRSISSGPYCYPFSAEQISEITNNERPSRSEYRLMLLSKISQNIYFENTTNSLKFRTESTGQVFKTISEVALPQNWEADFSNIVSFEQMSTARTEYGLSTENLNNLTAEEAIKKIDFALSSYEYKLKEGEANPPRSLRDIIDYTNKLIRDYFTPQWESMGVDIESQLRKNNVTSLFSLMDSFGFWSDSKSTYKKGSRLADSRHAFNGSYFNILVSRDRRFFKKSEAAYKYFDIETQCLHTDDFKVHLDKLLKSKVTEMEQATSTPT